jgi:Ulp1 protease family, C-terminal catalytic domain
MVCHPRMSMTKRANADTCYDASMLTKIRDSHNQRTRTRPRPNRNKNINKKTKQIFSNNVADIVRDLRQLYPKGEKSWLDVLPVDDASKSKYGKYFFSPKRPKQWTKDKRTWLSNFDILAILEQYEEVYLDFKFIGPSPIDFDDILENKKVCVTQALCGFKLQTHIDNRVRKIGVVFNLDAHNQDGSHWVSMFIDIEHGVIFYFDSLGAAIPPRIMKFVKRIVAEGESIGTKMVYHSNVPKVHQKGNSECGMYSLYFIITMLTNASTMDKKIAYFKNTRITDKFIFALRDKYFN